MIQYINSEISHHVDLPDEVLDSFCTAELFKIVYAGHDSSSAEYGKKAIAKMSMSKHFSNLGKQLKNLRLAQQIESSDLNDAKRLGLVNFFCRTWLCK